MNRTVSLEDDAVDPHRYGDKRIGFHYLKLTDKEREFLAPYRAAWHDYDDTYREPGVRLEDPEAAEGEYNGADDEALWWKGNIYADDLPSERLRKKPVVRL